MDFGSDVGAFLAVLDGEAGVLPEGFQALTPQTVRAEEFLAALGWERLQAASLAVLEGRVGALRPGVEALLEHVGHWALRKGLSAWVLRAIELLHRLRPDDVSVSLWLAMTIRKEGPPERVVALMSPFVAIMLEYSEVFAEHIKLLLTASQVVGRFDIILVIAKSPALRGANVSGPGAALCRRLLALEEMGADLAGYSAAPDALLRAFAAAFLTVDEFGMLGHLRAADERADASPNASEAWDPALVLASLCWAQGWSRAYRLALRLARRLIVGTGEGVAARWLHLSLPPEGLEAFLAVGGIGADGSGIAATLEAFRECPSLDTAQEVWASSLRVGPLADVAIMAPDTADPAAEASRARALVHGRVKRGGEAPLWVVMTWLKGADRLLRVASAYVGQATLIVSIGGDGVPADLGRASALLLADDVHLLSRPVVTWGGQRGMYHNMFEIMEAFRATAPAGAWLQAVCDRSYPMQCLQRLRRRTAELGSAHRRSGPGPQAWKTEWPEDIAAALPRKYSSAVDEVFETGLATQFEELATKSPLYGDNDDRLRASVFNFADVPMSVVANSWHSYLVSPLDIEVRWMSFARLQSFVDVSNESRTTYSRRQHPMTMRWVHEVLSKYDLRIGSPWVFISAHYVATLLDHPGLPELFSALDLGFAPEMNLFDTVAASLGLENDFDHLYHVFEGEDALDAELPAACISADAGEQSFIRKTHPDEGAELVRFFADRIFEDDSAGAMHWAVHCGGRFEDGVDPRPTLDQALIDRLIGARVSMRDLLDRVSEPGLFGGDGQLLGRCGRRLGRWVFDAGALSVAFDYGEHGEKSYRHIGGSARVLTLVPDELVSPHNGWSIFLDFDLGTVFSDPVVERVGAGCCSLQPDEMRTWFGSGVRDVAMLAALSDPGRSGFPTPTIEREGTVHAFRRSEDGVLALASVGGLPTLLRAAGGAELQRQSVFLFTRAGEHDRVAWEDAAVTTHLRSEGLSVGQLVGSWRLRTLYQSCLIRFRRDNWIVDAADVEIGRWIVRRDGVQILGVKGLIVALAGQFRYGGVQWRLSGWGWRDMKRPVSFSLATVSGADMADERERLGLLERPGSEAELHPEPVMSLKAAHLLLERLWALALDEAGARPANSGSVEFEILARRQRGRLGPDWERAGLHVAAGHALRADGKVPQALGEYAAAFAHTAPSTDVMIHVVTALVYGPELRAAETWARRMIAHGSDTAEGWYHLALAVWNSGRHDEALEVCDDMVAKFPHHANAVATAANFYMAKEQPGKALAASLALLASDETPVTSQLCDLLARAAILDGGELPDWCLRRIEAAAAAADAAPEIRQASAMLRLRDAAGEAWTGLFGTGRARSAPLQADGESRAVLERLLNASPAPEVISLYDLPALQRAYPDEVVRPDALEAEGFEYPGTARAGTQARDGYISAVPAGLETFDPVRRTQLTVIAEGVLTLLSPFGGVVRSSSSIVVYHHPEQRQNGCVICFYVPAPRPLFAIFATEAIWPVAWYDPVREIVLLHGELPQLGAYMRQIVRELKYALLYDVAATERYFRGDEARRGKPVTVLFGVLDYLSSHVLDLQGVQKVVDAGLAGALGGVVVTAPEPLGPVEEYFPELEASMVQRAPFRDSAELNAYLWRANAVCMRVTGGYVDPRVAGRVLARAEARVEPGWKAQVDALAADAYPVVFVALRASTRRWLADPAEVAGMFAALRKDCPRLGLIFDGYSSVAGQSPPQVSSEAEMLGAIRDELPPGMTALMAAGRPMEDAIYAAGASHMHLSAQGTTGVKAVVIANKPGVVIGPRQFTFDVGGLRHPRPSLVRLQAVDDAVEGTVESDFRMDAALVLAALKEVLGEIGPAPASTNGPAA